jgi:hypothetical protein
LLPEVADLRLTYTGDRDGDGDVDFRSTDMDPIPTAVQVTAWNAWRGVRSAALELLVTTEQDHVAPAQRVPVNPSWPPNDGGGDGVHPDTIGAGLPADGRFYERVVVNVTARASTPWYATR